MTSEHSESTQSAELRRLAEAALQSEGRDLPDISPQELPRLVHELRTYQIELEMQNEELRTAQEELIESRDRYSHLYDFAPVGYLTASDKGFVVQANLTAAEMLGVERARLIKERLSTFVVDDDEDIYYLHRRQILETRERRTCELRMHGGDGNPFWAEMDSTFMEAPDGSGRQIRTVMVDITDRRQAEKELKNAHVELETRVDRRTAQLAAANAELERKNAELERFSYTVSHDLKSPLITIKGFLGLLGEQLAEGNPARMNEKMTHIVNAADRMLALLDDLLRLSRIGRVVDPPEDVALEQLWREAAELVAGRLLDGCIQVEISPELPVVDGDRRRLLEVLQNLLENAIKYMGDQPNPRIEIGARQDSGETVCYVRDNGIGIEPRFHEKVFGLFSQLDRVSEGTGVGLAMVKRIVELHGGRIWVESEGPGRGSTFCFTISPKKESIDHAESDDPRRAASCSVG